jgi:hypothetical protein
VFRRPRHRTLLRQVAARQDVPLAHNAVSAPSGSASRSTGGPASGGHATLRQRVYTAPPESSAHR